jgi:hypothetical protein
VSDYYEDKMKDDEMGRVRNTYGELRNAYIILVGKPEGKIPVGNRSCRCEDNIKVDLKDVEWECLYWILLGLDSIQWWTVVTR